MKEQIEKIAHSMCRNHMQNGKCAADDEFCNLECVYGYCAERVYCAGYRKQTEVAREIFEQVDGITDLLAKGLVGELEFYDMLAELKKKYLEDNR